MMQIVSDNKAIEEDVNEELRKLYAEGKEVTDVVLRDGYDWYIVYETVDVCKEVEKDKFVWKDGELRYEKKEVI